MQECGEWVRAACAVSLKTRQWRITIKAHLSKPIFTENSYFAQDSGFCSTDVPMKQASKTQSAITVLQ